MLTEILKIFIIYYFIKTEPIISIIYILFRIINKKFKFKYQLLLIDIRKKVFRKDITSILIIQ